MKWMILTTLLTLVSLTKQCTKNKESGTPVCIQTKIDSIKNLPKWNPPAEVNEYSYNNKTVYLFSSNCCDQYNIAYDAACNYVCAPSGGFTGKGDGKCPDFESSAKFVRLVWKDDR
jgi:hypothetical protein